LNQKNRVGKGFANQSWDVLRGWKMNMERLFLSDSDAGMTSSKGKRVRPINSLIATAILLAFLFTGCASAPTCNAPQSPQTPVPTSLPSDKKGSMRTIGVVLGGDPQFAMQAYKKDQQAMVAGMTLGGGIGGFGVSGMLAFLSAVGFGTLFLPFGGDAASNASNRMFAELFPWVLVGTGIGAGVGLVAATASTVPAKRTEEIEANVFPALSDFPFRESMVEQIMAAGTSNTEYSFLDLDSSVAHDNFSGEIDALLEVSVPKVDLREIENNLQLSATVRARLSEKKTGTLLAQRTLTHVWLTFGKNRPKAGDEPLMREEIDGYLHALSEDIVDTLFLMEAFPRLYLSAAGVSASPFGGLRPKNPKRDYGLFDTKWKSATVDSLQPRLEWVPFPSQQDRDMDTKGKLKDIGQVSYDLRIWRLAEEMHHPAAMAYERKGLVAPWHTVEQPLEYGKTYYWAVRARFVRNGHATVTQWTTCPGFLPIITMERPTSFLSALYTFSTPPLPNESESHPLGGAR
jgi:hypothetical protein